MTKTILLVDDDATILQLITTVLERDKYHVITASNGPESLDRFRAEQPDLIVLDIAMPEMNGFDVARQIRAFEEQESRPRTPIILLTAYARSFYLSASNETGIDSYLTKPIEPDKLLKHIRRFLDPDSGEADGSGESKEAG